MGTIRRIRRHQHALIFAAGLLGALAPVSARAETPGFELQGETPAPQFVPENSFAALPLTPDFAADFEDAGAVLSDEAVTVAVRIDLDRLAAPADVAETALTTDSGPIEIRITRVFARFDDDVAQAPRSTDLAARRWTPVVSQALFAGAYPAR